jgi:oligoendopeptidase F
VKIKTVVIGTIVGLIALVPLTGFADAPRSSETHSIDQTRYFATPRIEALELKQRLDEAAALARTAPDDPVALAAYLKHAEFLLAQLERHDAYLHLRASRDIEDRADADAGDRTGEAMDTLVDTVGAALGALGEAAFAKDVETNPDLSRYAYLLARAERTHPHELPKDQALILHELADPAAANSWILYQQTVRSTPFKKLESGEAELDVKKDARLLAQNPERTVRRAAWQARWDGYASREEIYANILFGIVRMNDRVARLEHFPDAPSKVYFARDLDRKDVAEALARIEKRADLLKNYQRSRSRHIAAVAGITDVRPWDWSLPVPGLDVPRLSLDESRAEVLAALAPLGAEYVEHFRQLLDPANRRMDVAAEPGKRTNAGFSIGAPGVPSGLFVESYGPGLLADTRVVIHEGGHAIHRQLMSENGVSPFYTRGPNWMFEAFAILNEYLLCDHLYQASADPKLRVYYLEALIDNMAFQIFTSAEEATLEQSVYDGVVAGRIRNGADLDALSLSIWRQYEIWPATEPQFGHVWATKSLMFEDPLYLVNYLYAGLLATKMFDLVEREPAAFQQRYAELLREGFYAPPEDLLRSLFGRSLSQHELVDDGLNILRVRMQALADAYKKLDDNRAE